jgi:hypothetical protein
MAFEVKTTYRGSCHCKRVTFELQAKIDFVVSCNCSICRRRAALWHGAADADVRIVTGEDQLQLYQLPAAARSDALGGESAVH